MTVTHTITLTDAMQSRMARVVGQHNAAHSTELTVTDWLNLHIRELAISQDLAAEHKAIKEQAEADVTDAMIAVKQRLLAEDAGQGGA